MGFATVALDKAIFVNNPEKGVKYWSRKWMPVVTAYKGSHDRVVAYGALMTDGRQFVRMYEKFDKETFLRYLKALVVTSARSR